MASPSVTAIDRVIDIFEAFRARRGPMSLTELAEAAVIPKSTCHAIVTTLAARGYLYTRSYPRSLYPTRRMYDVARDIGAADTLIEMATPQLERLRDATTETVILGKRQGDAAVYLRVIEGLHPIRYSARPGDLKPLHSSSIGKALLGSIRQAQLGEWLQGRALERVTTSTVTDAHALEREILQSRRAGFFQTCGENVSDVWAVAAFMTVNRETLAVAVAGPRNRMEANMLEHARQLAATCSLISRELDTPA